MKKIAIKQKVNPSSNINNDITNQMSQSIIQKEIKNVRISIKKLWNIIPLFIKFLSLSSILLHILNKFFKSISFYLSNIPLYTIFHFQFWRIITSFLITTNIFNVILVLICWTREGSSMETSLGTLKYIAIFLQNNILIQILYTIIISIISLVIRNKNFLQYKIKYINEKENIYFIRNCGLWPVSMCELTLLCICNPNTKVKFLFIPFQFSAKYYPMIWLIIFCSFNNFNNDIEVLCGILYAFIYQNFLRFYLKISDSFIEKIEKKICSNCILEMIGFVSVNHIKNKFGVENDIQKIENKTNNRKKIKKIRDNIERNIRIASEYTNRNENSIISESTPPSLLDTSFGPNKIFP